MWSTHYRMRQRHINHPNLVAKLIRSLDRGAEILPRFPRAVDHSSKRMALCISLQRVEFNHYRASLLLATAARIWTLSKISTNRSIPAGRSPTTMTKLLGSPPRWTPMPLSRAQAFSESQPSSRLNEYSWRREVRKRE
jgi:hypothetical protein